MVSDNLKSFVVLCLMCWCIDAQPPGKPPDLSRKMMGLLNTCFSERLNPVVTTPDLHDSFLEEKWQTIKPPMILIDKNFVSNDVQQHYPRFATFVFAPYSVKSFETMLLKVTASPWWHKDALFFIIGDLRDGCKSAKKILEFSWKMNSSSALFLCRDEGRHAMLYTFNPFRNEAPHPWIETGGSNKLNTHWTMYKQKYHGGRKNCASLMFNKATFTEKQQSDSSSKSKSRAEQTRKWVLNFNNVGDRNSPTTSYNTLQSLLSVVDMSAILGKDHPCYPYDGKQTSFITQLINKLYDMVLMARDFVRKTIPIGPMEHPGFLLSKHPGNTCIIPLVAFGLVIMIYENVGLESDLLKSFAPLFCGWGRARKIPSKYLLFGFIQSIFLLSIISKSYLFTGTIQTGFPHVNDSMDLMNHQCNTREHTFKQNNFEELEQKMGYKNSEKVVDISAKCEKVLWQTLIRQCRKQTIISNSDGTFSHWCRENTWLREEMDRLQPIYIEANYWDMANLNCGEQCSKNLRIAQISTQYRPIQLRDLKFAYAVLLTGMFLSMVIFIIETYEQLATKMKNVHV